MPARTSTSDEVCRVLEGDTVYSATVWRKLIDMGAAAAAIPEAYGGAGLGYLELCLVAEEAGHHLAPAPPSSSFTWLRRSDPPWRQRGPEATLVAAHRRRSRADRQRSAGGAGNLACHSGPELRRQHRQWQSRRAARRRRVRSGGGARWKRTAAGGPVRPRRFPAAPQPHRIRPYPVPNRTSPGFRPSHWTAARAVRLSRRGC